MSVCFSLGWRGFTRAKHKEELAAGAPKPNACNQQNLWKNTQFGSLFLRYHPIFRQCAKIDCYSEKICKTRTLLLGQFFKPYYCEIKKLLKTDHMQWAIHARLILWVIPTLHWYMSSVVQYSIANVCVCPRLYSIAHVCVFPQLYSIAHVCVCLVGEEGLYQTKTSTGVYSWRS